MYPHFRSNRARFGTDAENYCSSLFSMLNHPDGYRRPDLISKPKTYSPRLTIELKSAKGGKGIIIVDQLEYGINRDQDYYNEINNLSKQPYLILPKINKDIVFYYNVIERVDNLKGEDLNEPYSAIQLLWGNQHIVPHELVFNIFAISYARRDKKSTDNKIMVENKKLILKKLIQETVAKDNSLSTLRKIIGRNNAWQTLESRIIKSLVTEDFSSSTKLDILTIDLLKKHYIDLSKLKKIIISGPNNTNIYGLISPKHKNLFEEQFSKTIDTNIGKIEKISKRRKELVPLIKSFPQILKGEEDYCEFKFANGNLSIEARERLNLTLDEIHELDYLCKWKFYEGVPF